jgi:hypothetical protein
VLTSPLTDDYTDEYGDTYGRLVRLFTPPVVQEAVDGDDRLLRFFQAQTQSFSVLVSGTSVQVRDYPSHPDDWDASDMVFLGGHQYEIDEAMESLLRGGGLPDECFWARG